MDKYIYRAKLDRVVDGDTIDAMIDVGFDIWVKKRIRYKGIDTWESRTRDLDEKKKGLYSINDTLIKEGHAYVYDGGTKKVFTENKK